LKKVAGSILHNVLIRKYCSEPGTHFSYWINCKTFIQGSSQSGPVLTPAEVLIAIHGIDPERDGIPLKKVGLLCWLSLCIMLSREIKIDFA
jgi:hypothetical protein